MAVHLKDDWKPVGKSPSARMLADWMNTVARLFNFASVPSGGTAQATATGFQIEIDSEKIMPFRVRVGVGDAVAYMEAYYPQAGIVRMNGRTVIGFTNTINAGYIHTTQAHSNASGWVVVRLTGVIEAYIPDPWNTDSGIDYMVGELAYVTSLPDPANNSGEFWRQHFPVARCVYSGGEWTITQLHEGAITFNGWGADSTLATLQGESAMFPSHSIEMAAGYHGAMNLYGIKNPTGITAEEIPPGNESGISIQFVMRYSSTAGIFVKYFDTLYLAGLIANLYDFDTRFENSFSTALHNDLDGLQGGAAADDGPPAVPAERYHLTAAEHSNVQTLLAIEGITENVTWEDVNGQVHTLEITGGIITAHTVA